MNGEENYNVEEIKRKGKKYAKWGILIALFLILIIGFNPFVKIGAGERGVVMNFGAVQDKILGEGLHFRVPIMQVIEKIDVRIQKSETTAAASSKDLQDVRSTIALNYHIMPDRANWVYQNLGREFKMRVIDPAVQESVKAVTAKYTAVELIGKRQQVSEETEKLLTEKLAEFALNVDGFSIIDLEFSRKFINAIESKQEAEQLALKAVRDLERIKIEAEQKITEAHAEAESLRLQKEQITPLMVKLRQIEMLDKKWDGAMPRVIFSGGQGGVIPLMDIGDLTGK